MEDALQKLMKEAGSSKYASIATSAHKALEILEAYNRASPFEYRRATLDAVKNAFDIGSSKIVAQAIVVLQKLLRDDRFHSKNPEEEEAQWISSQVLATVHSMQNLSEDQRQDVLKIILTLTCQKFWCLKSHIVLKVFTLCLGLYQSSGSATRAAAQATCFQTVAEYAKKLHSIEEDPDTKYNDILPVFQFITSRLDALLKNSTESASELGLLLQCLYALVNQAPDDITKNPHFKRYVCTKLSPIVIAYLDLADRQQGVASEFWKRGAKKTIKLSEKQVKLLCQVCVDLTVLFGPESEMRPVLESLSHRLFICSQPKYRNLAFQCLKEQLSRPDKVFRLAFYESVSEETSFDAMPIFKIIADSIEESSRLEDNPQLVHEATETISTILDALSQLAMGHFITKEKAEEILNAFPTLEEADYSGPNFYDGTSRLPKEYVQRISVTSGEDCDLDDAEGEDNQATEETKAKVFNQEKDSDDNVQEIKEKKPSVEINEKVEKSIETASNGDVENDPDDNEKGRASDNEKIEKSDAENISEKYPCFEETGEESDVCSEDTEGPEEGYEDDPNAYKLDAYMNEADGESASFNSKKIPKSFNDELSIRANEDTTHRDETNEEELQSNERDEKERENARIFVSRLKENLNHVIKARGSVEMDHRLQAFASKFCHEFSTHSPSSGDDTKKESVIILNADGVYLASYYTLHLNMFLAMNGFYSKENTDLPPPSAASRQHFLENILGSGLLIYVSPVWLSEIYDLVTDVDVFGFSYVHSESSRINHGLKNLLMDLDGFDLTHQGAQLLSDMKLLRPESMKSDSDEDERMVIDAGKRIARRILTTCWSSFLTHLNATLSPFLKSNGKSAASRFANRLFKGRQIPGGSSSSASRLSVIIECLQKAMFLCNLLELHNMCGEMLEPLTSFICPEFLDASSQPGLYNLSNLICIEDILKNGIELASQSQDCWKYVMRCVTFVLKMEVKRNVRKIPIAKKVTSETKPFPQRRNSDLDLNFEPPNYDEEDDDESGISQSAFAMPPGFDHPEEPTSLREFFVHYLSVKDKNTYLNTNELATACTVLTQRVDSLFDDAATKLNLRSLTGFMQELSFCSHKELVTVFSTKSLSTKIKNQNVTKLHQNIETLLFHRICEVMLKCIKSGRPLLHIIRAWAVVGPHLMQAACHKDVGIAKKSVEYIHDIILLFLQNSEELPYFHFNETLFKPFENLVCLELCDTDIQDQIVTCICEFVETSTTEIGSGWRSLFGTLREVRFPLFQTNPTSTSSSYENHWRAVLDVFEAFLATENPQIFANAALDYISCLIHHVKGGEERQQLEELIPSLQEVELYLGTGKGDDLTVMSLKYLEKCHAILSRMYRMSNCPVFQGSHRIGITKTVNFVDPVIPDFELRSFDPVTDTEPEFPYSFKALQTSTDQIMLEAAKFLTVHDSASGLLRVWYVLIDGLTSSLMNCPKESQSVAVDTLFKILYTFQVERNNCGELDLMSFGLFCTNHLLLPMIQAWLRRSQRTFQGWLSSGPNFKHCMGKTVEFVMNWLSIDEETRGHKEATTLAFKQILLILIECTVVPVESVARLGCSCFRYVLINFGDRLTKDQWTLLCLSLCRANQLALYPIHQLMAPFYQGSENFYGDIGDVKVAARRDSCKKEMHRLVQLAQQVMLLDKQRSDIPNFPDNPEVEERSFLFLLQPPGAKSDSKEGHETQETLLRVPMRNILTGLTAHHILLQLYGMMLLQGTDHIIPSLANLLLHSSVAATALTPFVERKDLPGEVVPCPQLNCTKKRFSGVLDKLNRDQVHMLLCSLRCSYRSAIEFDSRPGLKFLVQKVAQLSEAANLYKQAGATWSMIALTLFELCLARIKEKKVSSNSIKQALKDEQKIKNTHQFSAVQTSFVSKDTTSNDDNEHEEDDLTATNSFFIDLHNIFNDICELYIDIIVDKDGHHSKLDSMSKQPLYFLTVIADDFHEFIKRPEHSQSPKKSPGSKRTDQSTSGSSRASIASSKKSLTEDDARSRLSSSSDTKKPFQFSDFAKQPIRPESPNVSDNMDLNPKEMCHSDRIDSLDQDLEVEADDNEDADEEVFRMATQEEMDSMMSEYRYQKKKRTLPSVSSNPKDTPPSSASVHNESTSQRKNPFLAKPKSSSTASSSADPEIVIQQKESLMKDSEAQTAVWTELVMVFLHLSSSLNDEQFKVFLPVLFPGVKSLTAYAKDNELKQKIADFFNRVGSIYEFNAENS